MDIRELIEYAASGDPRAVAELYDRYKNNVYFLCLKLTEQGEDVAAGMMQSTYMHVFSKLAFLKVPQTFGVWSYTTAAKRCRSYLLGDGQQINYKKTAVQLPDDAGYENKFPYADDGAARSALIGNAEACAAVGEAVDKLPTAERFCTLLYFFCGLSVDQIARNMQASQEDVRRCIISGANLIGGEIRTREKKIPALAEYKGPDELRSILESIAAVTAVPERVSDTIIATGLSVIASTADNIESQEFVQERGGGRGRIVAFRIAFAVLLLAILGAVVAAAVKIVPGLIGGGETSADGGTSAPPVSDTLDETTAPEPDTSTDGTTDAAQTEETSAPDTDPVTTEPPETDAPQPEGYDSDPANYRVTLSANGSATINGYTGNSTRIAIPAEINGVPVKNIGEGAFSGNRSITAVQIPSGVEYIGTYAFLDCSSLTEISIPTSVKRVGRSVLTGTAWIDRRTDDFVVIGDGVLIRANTKAKEITVPDSVKYIANAFYYNGTAEKINLPSSVWGIGEMAFTVCVKLESITLPSSVTEIDDGAFLDCGALAAIDAPAGSYAAQWCASHGMSALLKTAE